MNPAAAVSILACILLGVTAAQPRPAQKVDTVQMLAAHRTRMPLMRRSQKHQTPRRYEDDHKYEHKEHSHRADHSSQSENYHNKDQNTTAKSIKVVYAAIGSSIPKYAAITQAQLDTWAGPLLSEGRYFATWGNKSGSLPALHPQLPDLIAKAYQSALKETPCDDKFHGLACKEITHIQEGLSRGADWLIIVGTDNWVDTPALEKALAAITEKYKARPVAMGAKGCGLAGSCPEFPGGKGVCGGGGYMLNRAALSLLVQHGNKVWRNFKAKSGVYNDVVTSCELQKLGGEIVQFPHSLGGLVANRIMRKQEMDRIMDHRPLVMHYLNTPALMHYVDSRMSGEEQVSEKFAKDAFDKGCCCSCHTDICHDKFQKCQRDGGSLAAEPGGFLQMAEGPTSAKFAADYFEDMASRYIEQRNKEYIAVQ